MEKPNTMDDFRLPNVICNYPYVTKMCFNLSLLWGVAIEARMQNHPISSTVYRTVFPLCHRPLGDGWFVALANCIRWKLRKLIHWISWLPKKAEGEGSFVTNGVKLHQNIQKPFPRGMSSCPMNVRYVFVFFLHVSGRRQFLTKLQVGCHHILDHS